MKQQRLIIFTRYPEPGRTKTRLIPVLGAEGAAQLQQRMTEHTLAQASGWRDRFSSVEVYFTGGNEALMQQWLGTDVTYRHQGEGELGQRMQMAFAQSFAAEVARVVIIGTDCPDVSATLLTEAFAALSHSNLVLGPAADGGYYLIGLNRPIPELFTGIPWGTDQVLATTQEIAQRLGLGVFLLPVLNDVDRREDLPIWERHH